MPLEKGTKLGPYEILGGLGAGGMGNEDIWVHDLVQGGKTRSTFAAGSDRQPVWSPDRTKIAWGANRDGRWQILQRASNGGTGEEVLYESSDPTNLSEWSKDGKFILFHKPSRRDRCVHVALEYPEADRLCDRSGQSSRRTAAG